MPVVSPDELTGMVDIIAFVAVLMIVTVDEPSLQPMYALLPSGLMQTQKGSCGGLILDTTWLVATLIIEIVPSPEFAIYAYPSETGVAVIFAVIGKLPLFTAVNEPILPTPLAANPIPGVSLVQLKVVPVPVKLTAAVFELLFTVWLDTVFTVGKAFTVPDTNTVWFAAPVELKVTLPDNGPSGSFTAERIYTVMVLKLADD